MTFGQELMKTAIASARGGRIIAIRTMDFPKMLTLLPGMIFFQPLLNFVVGFYSRILCSMSITTITVIIMIGLNYLCMLKKKL